MQPYYRHNWEIRGHKENTDGINSCRWYSGIKRKWRENYIHVAGNRKQRMGEWHIKLWTVYLIQYKVRTYKKLVRHVLECRSKKWTLMQIDQVWLRTFGRKFVRKICCPVHETEQGIIRNCTNFIVHRISQEQPHKAAGLWWTGQLQIGNNDIPYWSPGPHRCPTSLLP